MPRTTNSYTKMNFSSSRPVFIDSKNKFLLGNQKINPIMHSSGLSYSKRDFSTYRAVIATDEYQKNFEKMQPAVYSAGSWHPQIYDEDNLDKNGNGYVIAYASHYVPQNLYSNTIINYKQDFAGKFEDQGIC